MVRREIRGLRRRETGSDLRGVLDHLDPRFRQALHAAAGAYRRLGVRYALIGGVAAGAYGRPRATKDIDFLVGDEAFDSVGSVISFKAGVPQEACEVPIDNIPPHVRYRDVYERALDGAVESDEPGVLIATPEMVGFTKLVGGRMRDVAAVAEMLESGTVDPDVLERLLMDYPELHERFGRAVIEWRGQR
jgi:hypothetical protein